MFRNNLINALTVLFVILIYTATPIIKWILNAATNQVWGIVLIILIGVIAWLIGYFIIGLIVMPFIEYKNPAHYNYKTKTVKMGNGVTKYCAIVQTEFCGYSRYIVKSKEHSWFTSRVEYDIFDKVYNLDYCTLEDRKNIYYDNEADALFAIKEFKERVEAEYKSDKAYKQKKKHEEKMMKEVSSKTTTIKFKNNNG